MPNHWPAPAPAQPRSTNRLPARRNRPAPDEPGVLHAVGVRSHDNQKAYVRYRRDAGDNESMERTALTPGKLYSRLSAEFKILRPARCESCAMPMPHLVRRSGEDAPNWAIGDEVA